MPRIVENDDVTAEQNKAIKGLERALKKCAEAKVALYGMSGELTAYNGKALDNAFANDEITDENGTEFPSTLVTSYGAYRDSGADDPWKYIEGPHEYKTK